MAEKEKSLDATTTIITPEGSKELISLRRYQLVVLAKDGSRRKYELGKKKTYRIGKKTDNDIVIVSDRTVSRQHTEIECTLDNQYLIRDLNSTNGTSINGMKVKEAFLSQGDLITVGETQIEFQTYDERVQIEPSQDNFFADMVGRSKKMRQIFGIL